MTFIDTKRSNANSTGILGQIYRHTIGFLTSWNDVRMTRNALNRLSDRELEDIGLSRGDIDQVVTRL